MMLSLLGLFFLSFPGENLSCSKFCAGPNCTEAVVVNRHPRDPTAEHDGVVTCQMAKMYTVDE